MTEFETVAQVGEIPEGEGRAYPVGDQMVAVFNDGGSYHAIDDMCPHMGASLASGHYENCVVTCPWHGWSFDTRDGAWCDNRKIKIDAFEVRVVGSDIQVAPQSKVSDPDSTSASPASESPSSTQPADSSDADQDSE